MRCLDRHIPNNNTLEEKLGNLEKNLQTADQTGDKLNLNMMPLQEWNSSHKAVGVGLFLPLLHICFTFAVAKI